MRALVRAGYIGGVLVLIGSSAALAQESKSTPLAKQLAAAMTAGKLDSVAARDPATPGVYIGALYIPNFQLLVIANTYAAPTLLDTRLTKKEYRDVYIDLNSATSAATPRLRYFGAAAEEVHVGGSLRLRNDATK